MRHLPLLRGAAILGCAVALAACTTNESRDVLGPTVPTGGAIFKSYVSLGNSLTAGYQSDGINDSTQRTAYPVLLAKAMGTSFVYPSLKMPGCQPPIANFQTGARVGPAGTCSFRNPALVADHLNNVAVPGANSADPTSSSTSASSILTLEILGGATQVQRALQAKPTFATVWIGNNDVLQPGIRGYPSLSTPPATFVSNYAAMMNGLKAGAPNLKGVLIGVVQIANAAIMTPGYVIAGSPQLQYAIQLAAGKPVAINPNCTGSTSLVALIALLQDIRSGAQPAEIACVKGSDPANSDVGDKYVLDDAEQVQLKGIIDSYNGYIKAKADSLGFGYYDPNPLLANWRATGAVPPAPNFASATAPFGRYISLDGVHPSAATDTVLADSLASVTNAKYGTSLPAIH